MLVISIHPTKLSPASSELIMSFPCSLGSSKENDIVVSHPSISPKHLVIEKRDSLLVVRDVSRTGIPVDDRRMTQVILNDNKSLKIGEIRMDFQVNNKQIKGIAKAVAPIRSGAATPAGTLNDDLTQKLPPREIPAFTSTASNFAKFVFLAAIGFAVLRLNTSYVRQAQNVAATIGSVAAARQQQQRILKDLAPEITDSTGQSGTAPPNTDSGQKPRDYSAPAQAPGGPRDAILTSQPKPNAPEPANTSATLLRPSALLDHLAADSFLPARTIPEKALALVTNYSFGAKFFALMAWAIVMGYLVRLRSPETPLAVPTVRAVIVFGLLLLAAHGLRNLMPVLNFNLDDHESYVRLSSMLVIALAVCIFQALMLFVMPDDSFQKKTVIAAGLTVASSFGFHKAVQQGLVELDTQKIPFKGAVAWPLRAFTLEKNSADHFMEKLDRDLR